MLCMWLPGLPRQSCCLEDLSSLGQAQLMFSELPVNKRKDAAYVTPLLDGSLGTGRQPVQILQADMGGGGLRVSAVPQPATELPSQGHSS